MKMETGIKVQDVMTRHPVTVNVTITVEEAAKLMGEKEVGSLLVLDKHGELFGIVTEQDIVRKVVAKGLEPSMSIKAAVEQRIFTIEPHEDIFEAMSFMGKQNIRHLPVLNNSKLVGFVTIKDILKIHPQLVDLIVDRMELKEQDKKLASMSGEELEL